MTFRVLLRACRPALVPLGFLVVAALTLWPLPLHLASALPGDPTGDTGVYIWNLWIFRHEFLDHARLPLSTHHIFAYSGDADFSLHNYTPLAGMIGMPLMPLLGVVGTFNTVLILLVAASGWATFVLGRRVGLSVPASWAAGCLFIATPTMTAREVAHLSLVSAAALPLFLWALFRFLDAPDRRGAVLVGLTVALASYSDAYFGIYCVLMGFFTLAWRFARISVHRQTSRGTASHVLRRTQWVCLGVTAGAALLVGVGVHQFTIAGTLVRVGLNGPVLLLTVATVARVWETWRPALHLHDPSGRLPSLTRLGLQAVAVCLVLMLPPTLGIIERYLTGRLPVTPILWRSSPRGVDLLAYFDVNPLSPLWGHITRAWLLPPQEDAFPEFIAGFSLVAVFVMAWAARREVLPRFWLAFTALFVSLSWGPFIHLAGVNTLVPGPWAFLRYVPLIGMARAPSRFAIVAVLGGSILFGFATDVLRRRATRGAAALVALLLVFELNPAPRQIFAADVPSVYDLISTGDESAAVLELPTGVRDGTSSLGDFNASTQFYQTRHHRRLVGGYLSRVSEWRKREMLSSPVLRSLLALSETSGVAGPDDLLAARADRDDFLARSCVGYVVVNRRKASPALRAAAVDILRLESLHADDEFELLRPVDPPPCRPPATTTRLQLARGRRTGLR